MNDNSPFLFVHMPLDELRGDRLIDASPNRRYAAAHAATIVPDPVFGSCLELKAARRDYVEFPPWKLNPEVFLPSTPLHPNAGNPPKLTFSIWISRVAEDGEFHLIDCGLRPALQRLRVRFKKSGEKLTFTVVAPAEQDQIQGFRWIAEARMPEGPWMHFALVWDPEGQGANRGAGECHMYLNGGFFSSSGKTSGEPPMRLSSAAALQTLLGWPSFHGKLAHFRIYTRALTLEEIVQDMDRDTGRQRISSPLEFSLLDPLNRPLMYLDFSDMGEKMQVIVKPLQAGLSLIHLPPGPPDPDRCHFELAFRPGTLDLIADLPIAASSRDGPGTWEAMAYQRTRPDGHDSVCIRCNAPRGLLPEGVVLVLNALKSDRRFAARWTQVDLRYRNLMDGQRPLPAGRLQQWLQLAPRNRRPLSVASTTLGQAWRGPGSSGIGLGIVAGRVRISGHILCEPVQQQMKNLGWQNLTTAFAPFGGKEIRFPGRVRWTRAAGSSEPRTLWWSDLILGPTGVLSIATDLPLEIVRAAARVEADLEGVSYSGERLFLV